MAWLISAVQVTIAWRFAETALRDISLRQFSGEAERHPIVEDEARTLEVPIGEFFAVRHDATLELSDIGEAMQFEECTCPLAADSSGAVGNDFAVLKRFQFREKLRKISEVLHRQSLCTPESSDRRFVVVPHVDENEIFIPLQCRVQLFRRDVRSRIFRAHRLSESDHFGS